MTINITGIDTTNDNVLLSYLNTTLELYQNYQQVSYNVVDASTFQIILSN